MSFWLRLRKWLGLTPPPAVFHLDVMQAGGLYKMAEILPGWAQLTPREQQVAWLMAQGCTNPQIAERLFISRETVKSHAGSVLRKLELRSRRELRRYARYLEMPDGVLPPGEDSF